MTKKYKNTDGDNLIRAIPIVVLYKLYDGCSRGYTFSVMCRRSRMPVQVITTSEKQRQLAMPTMPCVRQSGSVMPVSELHA